MKNLALKNSITVYVFACTGFFYTTFLHADAPPLPPAFGSAQDVHTQSNQRAKASVPPASFTPKKEIASSMQNKESVSDVSSIGVTKTADTVPSVPTAGFDPAPAQSFGDNDSALQDKKVATQTSATKSTSLSVAQQEPFVPKSFSSQSFTEKVTPKDDDEGAVNTSVQHNVLVPSDVQHKVISSGIDFSSEQDEAAQKMDEENDALVDTFDITTGGNWVLKRVWWEKTEDVYEKIKDVFSSVMGLRSYFIKQRNDFDREADIFYGEMGIDQSPLQNLIHQAQDLMQKEKEEQGYLDKKERAFVDKLAGKERTLEQLKLDIKGIQELDQKIDEALDTLFHQIDTCNDYEQKAWNNFKEIARELNDKKARVLYYDTETVYKDCLKIEEYIKHPFTAYFNEIVESAKEHMQKIAQQMNGLKKEGIDLVKEAQELEKDEVVPDKQKDTQQAKQKRSDKSWYIHIYEYVKDTWNSFFSDAQKIITHPQKTLKKEEQSIEQVYEDDKQAITKEFEHDKDAQEHKTASHAKPMQHHVTEQSTHHHENNSLLDHAKEADKKKSIKLAQ